MWFWGLIEVNIEVYFHMLKVFEWNMTWLCTKLLLLWQRNSYCATIFFIGVLKWFQDVQSLHPTLKISIDDQGSIFNRVAAKYEVFLDRTKICTTGSIFNGLQLLWALFQLFNVQYPTSLNKTYIFISSFIVGLKEVQLSPCQDLYNRLTK